MLRINDKVRVINQDECYDTYTDFFKVYKLGKYLDLYVVARNNYEGYIREIKPHEDQDNLIYLVEGEFGVILMDKEGLEKVSEGDNE